VQRWVVIQSAVENRTVQCGPSIASTLSSAWPALLLAFACLLPFLNKAFLIDDPHFLAMAKQILRHPLHPMDFEVCWNLTENCTKAYALTPGNALMGYALVPTILGGESEWIAHATQLVFAVIAIIAMSSLVLRFGWDHKHAMISALLLVAIPPFLPMASTAMPDLLAATVGLVAMERLAAWKAEQKWSQALAAALALGLAGFARSHLVLLLPLGAFFLLESTNPREILDRFRSKSWLFAPVLAGGIFLLSIILITRERSVALDPPSAFRGTRYMLRNFRSYMLYMAFPLPLAACWTLNRWRTARWRVAAALILAASICAYTRYSKLATFLAVVGLCTLGDLVIQAWRRQQHQQLLLLLWVLIPLPIIYYGHLPIKYLLPCMPAVILICLQLSTAFTARMA